MNPTEKGKFLAALLVCIFLQPSLFAAEEGQTCFERPELYPEFSQLNFISVPLAKAYPGAEYNIRPAVIGGTWPYQFELLIAPAGMTIDAAKGTISWVAPTEERSVTVALQVSDTAGLQAKQEFSIAVTKSGFYFLSPDGNDKNTGTFEQPWKTLERAVEPLENPEEAYLYLRSGTYSLNFPNAEDEKKASILTIKNTSARHWMAWPNEHPVIDLKWSEEKWKTALDFEMQRETEVVTTKDYGHRIHIDHEIDGFLFDGIEVKNASYYMFVMWDGNRRNLTWRRCHFHHLYGDYYENSSFIFTFAADRKWEPAGKEEHFPFGKQPKMKPYENMVVQDCQFTDRPYWNERGDGQHGGGLVWYTTRGCLVEDCRFERIQRGVSLMDKDCGINNTYRNNLILGSVMFAAQGFNEGIELHHNYIAGNLHVGLQPGWMRNIWVYHNAIKGEVALMAGDTQGPANFDTQGKDLAGPADLESQKVVKEFPMDQKLVHFYANIVADSNPNAERDAHTLGRFSNDKSFAERYRFLAWDHNLVDSALGVSLGWSGKRMEWTEFKSSGFDVNGTSGSVVLDDKGHLPEDSEWRNQYGRDADTTEK